jgi:cytochrome P450
MREDMQFNEWTIPRGMLVGMSQPMIHFNERIFPNPWTFDPERWLKGEVSKNLEKYLVSFSRGARECIAKQ